MAKNMTDLLECIEWKSIECLNGNPSHSHENALKQGYREDDAVFLASDDDEQILLTVPFNQIVKLHSVVIKGPPEEGPKVIKLYANRNNMGFSNTGDYPPSDVITMSESGLKEGLPIALKFVKFQGVRSVTVFVESNQGGGGTTRISKLAFLGCTVETTNMSEFKKIEHNH